MTPDKTGELLLYRDGLMLVLNKPAGIAVHKGPKGGVSLEDSFGALRFGLPRNPALAHRLDRETAGCLILGRHHKALEKLGLLFKQGKIGKIYWAVVEGAPATEEGRIDIPLGKLDEARGWWMKPDPNGPPSSTTWKVMGRGGGLTWLALEPLTGRTHQIRLHLSHLRYPIAGDPVYGGRLAQPKGATERLLGALRAFKHQALHAARLAFDHPRSGIRLTVQSPLPADYADLLAALREDAREAERTAHAR